MKYECALSIFQLILVSACVWKSLLTDLPLFFFWRGGSARIPDGLPGRGREPPLLRGHAGAGVQRETETQVSRSLEGEQPGESLRQSHSVIVTGSGQIIAASWRSFPALCLFTLVNTVPFCSVHIKVEQHRRLLIFCAFYTLLENTMKSETVDTGQLSCWWLQFSWLTGWMSLIWCSWSAKEV